jgi:hypothetical protein
MKFYPGSALRLEIFFVEMIDDRRFLAELSPHADVKSLTQVSSIFKHIPILTYVIINQINVVLQELLY